VRQKPKPSPDLPPRRVTHGVKPNPGLPPRHVTHGVRLVTRHQTPVETRVHLPLRVTRAFQKDRPMDHSRSVPLFKPAPLTESTPQPRSAHLPIKSGLETLIWEFLTHLKPDLAHSSAVTISTARSIILEGIEILIFATKGSKKGKVLNQVKDFGKILTNTILIQVVIIKHILVGIPTSIRESTIIHKHI
jgi:hypothetical protein